MSVVFPAPDTPIRQVSTPGRKQPLMSVSSTSCGLDAPYTASPFASEPCTHSLRVSMVTLPRGRLMPVAGHSVNAKSMPTVPHARTADSRRTHAAEDYRAEIS